MSWMFLTFLSVFSRAIYGVLTKVLSNKSEVGAYTQSILLPLSGFVLVLAFSPLLGGLHVDIQAIDFTLLALMIFGQGVGNIAYFTALRNLTSGTAQITFSSILVFNTILSVIFLNLELSLKNIAGIILLMVAISAVITGKLEFHLRGISLMLIASFCFAVFQLSSTKLATQMSAANYLSFTYLGSALFIMTAKAKVFLNDIKKITNISSITFPFITAIPSVLQLVFVYYAYRLSPEPAKVALLSTSQVVIAVILSYFFLNEKTQLTKKIIAGILVVCAAYLIKI